MKIACISPSSRNLANVARWLKEERPDRVVSLTEGGMGRLKGIVDQQQPDLIIVEGMCRDLDELATLDYVATRCPNAAVVLLCTNQTPEFLINAMRAGVREVLPSPVGEEALKAAVARIELKQGLGGRPRETGKILAFIACKGGSGATFLATNLAYQLASESASVLLVDCNLQFGDAVLFVHDRNPPTNLADVARNMHRLDATFLTSSLVQVAPGFGVLAAPEDPGRAMEVTPGHLDAILSLAVKHYDYVLVDLGRALDPVTLRVLDRADTIYPVLQMTLPFIRDASRLLSVFHSLGYPPEKISLLVNRFEKSGDLSLGDIERTLGIKNLRTIPTSYTAVAYSVNQGIPIARIARNNPVAKSLAEFAQCLLTRENAPGGWLGRWKKKA